MSGDANSIAEVLGVKPDNSDEVITAYSIKLAPFGVPADHFLETNYLQVGFLPKLFAKYLKALNAFNGDEHLGQVLQLGVSHGYFTTVKNCPAQDFYDFLTFLRSPAGRTELSRLVSERKKLKRSRPDNNVTDIETQSIDAKNVRVHIGHFAPSHEEKKPKKN